MTFPALTFPAAVTAAVSNANGMMGQMGQMGQGQMGQMGQGQMGQGQMGGHHGGRGFGDRGFDGRHGGPLMIVIPLLLLAAAAFGIGMYLRRRKGTSTVAAAVAGVAPTATTVPTTGPTVSGDDMAAAILRERFARGDINEVEYLHRKAVLEGRANVPANAPTPSDDLTVVAHEPNDPTS